LSDGITLLISKFISGSVV